MKKTSLISLLAVVFLVGHFLVVMLVIYFRFVDYYDTEKVKISLPIILPLFATHSIAILTYISKNAIIVTNDSTTDQVRYHPVFVFFSMFIPLLFITFVVGILIREAWNPFSNDDFAYYLGLSETIFGIFIGLLVREIYMLKKKES